MEPSNGNRNGITSRDEITFDVAGGEGMALRPFSTPTRTVVKIGSGNGAREFISNNIGNLPVWRLRPSARSATTTTASHTADVAGGQERWNVLRTGRREKWVALFIIYGLSSVVLPVGHRGRDDDDDGVDYNCTHPGSPASSTQCRTSGGGGSSLSLLVLSISDNNKKAQGLQNGLRPDTV